MSYVFLTKRKMGKSDMEREKMPKNCVSWVEKFGLSCYSLGKKVFYEKVFFGGKRRERDGESCKRERKLTLFFIK